MIKLVIAQIKDIQLVYQVENKNKIAKPQMDKLN